MDIRPIRTDEDHRAALAAVEASDLLVRPYQTDP